MSPHTHPRIRVRVRPRIIAVGLTITALLVSLVPAPAHAAAARYVALGDSYASGVGTRSYLADGTDCRRSAQSYGALVAGANGLDLTLAACSGAVTADVLADQVQALGGTTRYVSLTVGGNDVGFAPVLTECAKPGWMSDCDGAIDGALVVLRRDLPGRLAAVHAQIRARAPRAQVTVTGYPLLFNGTDCNAATFFSPSEQARLNASTEELNAEIARQAARAGFAFSAVKPTFAGHAVCDEVEWVNGLSWPVVESYHPNVAGHRAYARQVAPGLGLREPGAGTAASIRTVPATGSAPAFQAPDLSTPQAEQAAARAGIPPHELARLRAAQASGIGNRTLERMSQEMTQA